MDEVPPADPVPAMPGAPDPIVAETGTDLPAVPAKRRRWPIVVGALVLLLVAGGALAAWRLAGSGDVLLEAVPAGSEIVVTAYLDPAASQKVNLLRMAKRFPDVGSEDDLRQQVDEWLDQILDGTGLTHADREWVGSQALIWVDLRGAEDPRAAFVVAIDDAEAARTAMDRVRAEIAGGGSVTESTVDGTTVWTAGDGSAWTVTDDMVIFASESSAVEATLATHAGTTASITTDEGFVAAHGELPEESLGFAYVAMEEVLAAIEEMTGEPMMNTGANMVTDAAFSVSATSDGLVVDTVSRLDPAAETPSPQENLAARAVPADSVMAFGGTGAAEGLDDGIQTLGEQDPQLAAELERWGLLGPGGLIDNLRGDMAMGVVPASGDLPVGGLISMGIDDEAAFDTSVGRLIDAVEGELRGNCPTRSCPDVQVVVGTLEHEGTTVSFLEEIPVPVAWATYDGVAIIGSSPDEVSAALDAMTTGTGIATSDRFVRATELTGGDGDAFFMLDIQAALALARDAVPPEELAEFDQEVAPYLEPIDMIAAGSSTEGDIGRGRLVIAIPGGSE